VRREQVERRAGEQVSKSAVKNRPTSSPGPLFSCSTVPVVLLALVVAALLVIFRVAPVEETMGLPQKIFYLHLPCALSAFLGFFICFLASIRYLLSRDLRHDRLGASAAEVGVVFTTLVLVTGSIWARAAWGVWWTWDARLTTTAVLWCIYLGYLVLRANVEDDERRARVSAVVGIVGFADVPLVSMSIRWWQTMHPGPVLFVRGGSGLPDPWMRLTLALSSAAMLAVFAWLLYLRVEVAKLREESEPGGLPPAKRSESVGGPQR
jgi:heme exporter protein C